MPVRERNRWARLVDTIGVETHQVDLDACWRAWRAVQGSEGRLLTMRELAHAAEVSKETMARFMHGREHVSIRSGRRIIGALGLLFDEVAEPLEALSA